MRSNIVKKFCLLFNKKNQAGDFYLNYSRYKKVIKEIKNKVRNGQKIRVCFFVIYDFAFSYRPLYELMLNDDLFDPFIVVVPDLTKGEEHLNTFFKKTYLELSQKYPTVYKGYLEHQKKFLDFSEKTDVVCFQNVYKGFSHRFFEIEYFLNKPVLTFYVHYGFPISKLHLKTVSEDCQSYLWKVFVPTKIHYQEYKERQILKAKNVIVSGYCKMDLLPLEKVDKNRQTTILIAPHHTVTDWPELQLSNFLKYHSFFLELPKIYPNINFVFRPHPLLVTQLNKLKSWGKSKTERYLQQLENNPNMTYDTKPTYFDTFANSDAIIHDCGSFLAEYLFTGKPACYLLKDQESTSKWFSKAGLVCLEHNYKAYNENQITDFINEVVIDGHDTMKKERLRFVDSQLKINYPQSSKMILNYIKRTIS